MATGASLMNHTTADVGQIVGGAGALGAGWMFLRWLLTLAGGRQDARIAKLEREVEALTSRLMIVAQAAMELAADVERLDPESPSLKRARSALKKAFPVPSHQPADLAAMAAQVDTKD